MSTIQRRYDIDWLRVIAIGLLLIYHVAIGFQPWGLMIGFITNKEPLQLLWLPMAVINVWRIPLLFFVSGMGVYFAMQHRSLKELWIERATRILLPYIIGMICIFPLSVLLLQSYYKWESDYNVNPGHLWFLGNIFVYVIVLSPVFYFLKKQSTGTFIAVIQKFSKTPLVLLPVLAALVLEAVIVQPRPYELYAMTWHGFFLGLVAFLFGYCFVLCGDPFWKMLVRFRWFFFAFAVGLFLNRLIVFNLFAPGYVVACESFFWIITILAFARKHLNHGSKTVTYLSEAAYPVYITHMIFLFLGSYFIFPFDVPAIWKFVFVLLFTFGGCFITFEYLIRRVNVFRPLFGLKMNHPERCIDVPKLKKIV